MELKKSCGNFSVRALRHQHEGGMDFKEEFRLEASASSISGPLPVKYILGADSLQHRVRSQTDQTKVIVKDIETKIKKSQGVVKDVADDLGPLVRNRQALARRADKLLDLGRLPLLANLHAKEKRFNEVYTAPYLGYIIFLLSLFYSHCILLQTDVVQNVINDKFRTHRWIQISYCLGYLYGSCGLLRYISSMDSMKTAHMILFLMFSRFAFPLAGFGVLTSWNANGGFAALYVALALAGLATIFFRESNPVVDRAGNFVVGFTACSLALLAFGKGDYSTLMAAVLMVIAEFGVLQVRGRTLCFSGYFWRLLLLSVAVLLIACGSVQQSPGVLTGNMPKLSFYEWAYNTRNPTYTPIGAEKYGRDSNRFPDPKGFGLWRSRPKVGWKGSEKKVMEDVGNKKKKLRKDTKKRSKSMERAFKQMRKLLG